MWISPAPFPPHARRDGLCAAFTASGVALPRAVDSWSGVRASDGVVVIALRSSDVLRNAYECRCLLWSPGAGVARGPRGLDRRQRFFHCKLAAARGEAFALVTHGPDDDVDPHAGLLGIDVELRRGEYWAVWARAQPVVAPWCAQPGAEADVAIHRARAPRVLVACCA